MKKFLLSLLTVICAIGLANAETETVVMAGQTATYNDGSTVVLASTTLSMSNAKHFESVTLGELFTLLPEKGTGSSFPAYNKDKTFRTYANNIFTIKAADGLKMTKIEFIAPTAANTPSPSVGTYNNKVWTSDEPVSEVTFTNGGSGQFNFSSMTITYEQSGVVIVKEEAGMSFPEKEYEANLGEAFEAPILTKATTAPVTYTSSDETVATVDATTGAVTILAAGYTTIKATAEENDDFKAGMAEYQLKVVDPNKNEVTFDFKNNDYGMDRGNDYNPSPITFSEGKVTAEITKISGNGTRLWSDGLRVYKGENQITLSVPTGFAINKIVFEDAGLTITEGATTLTDNTWTGEAKEVTLTLTNSATKAITSITVSFAPVAVVENPEVPVAKIGGQEITDEYTLAGEEVELTFEVAEGTSIWYKFTAATTAAPAAEGEEEAENDGYTKLEGNTLTIGDCGSLSYYAEANGLKSEISTITFNGIPSGIEAIEADTNVAAEYFTIQGVKANPATLAPGLYIRRAGNKVSKVIIK